ncbi:MAG: hypothetical protein ACI9RO_001535 [Alteromonas macleodii]|jgi:hypothetical protein
MGDKTMMGLGYLLLSKPNKPWLKKLACLRAQLPH